MALKPKLKKWRQIRLNKSCVNLRQKLPSILQAKALWKESSKLT